MNRISTCLAELAAAGRKALVAYIVNGDPTPDITLQVMHTLVENGADIIELGVPFSDPMAEGPVIQKGHERALTHRVSLRDSLELVRQFRQTNRTTPVILMGYANPVERMGYRSFAETAAEVELDGLLTVDLPPEEAEELHALLREKEMESIFLLAPTSSQERIDKVASLAGGFIYYVSLKGVTGAGNLDVRSVAERVERIKRASSLPVMVGFGIKDPDSAKAVARVADGVVVGSALVAILGESSSANQALNAIKEKISAIRNALDDNTPDRVENGAA